VSLVVEKLLHIVEPDFLFLGQKDFQQCIIIKRLISLMGIKTRVIVCPILREENGLAMSSRNLRLSDREKEIASNLYQSLLSIKENAKNEDFSTLRKRAAQNLESAGFNVDYLELAKSEDLALLKDFIDDGEMVILVAAFLHHVRLIDNLVINPSN
jgi:pantoate--beta-alanine ligase